MILYKVGWKIKGLDNVDPFCEVYVIAKNALDATSKVISFEKTCGYNAVISSIDIIEETNKVKRYEGVIY